MRNFTRGNWAQNNCCRFRVLTHIIFTVIYACITFWTVTKRCRLRSRNLRWLLIKNIIHLTKMSLPYSSPPFSIFRFFTNSILHFSVLYFSPPDFFGNLILHFPVLQFPVLHFPRTLMSLQRVEPTMTKTHSKQNPD